MKYAIFVICLGSTLVLEASGELPCKKVTSYFIEQLPEDCSIEAIPLDIDFTATNEYGTETIVDQVLKRQDILFLEAFKERFQQREIDFSSSIRNMLSTFKKDELFFNYLRTHHKQEFKQALHLQNGLCQTGFFDLFLFAESVDEVQRSVALLSCEEIKQLFEQGASLAALDNLYPVVFRYKNELFQKVSKE